PWSPFFFFQAEAGIRDWSVTGVQTCALPTLAGDDAGADRARLLAPAATARARRLSLAHARLRHRQPRQRRLARAGGQARLDEPRSEERRVGKECRSRRWATR